MVWFYNQRAGAENLIKEANNDAGLAAHPSGRWTMNCNHFQLAMLAYNLNCWLMLFNREPQADVQRAETHDAGDGAAAVSVPGGQDLAPRRPTGVSYSDHYEEKGLFHRLMSRLRNVAPRPSGFKPVIVAPLC